MANNSYIIVLLTLSVFFFVESDSFENPLSILVASKEIKCYKCSSLKDEGCMNMTAPVKEESCSDKATGCLKHWVRTEKGKIIIYRDCFHGPISLFYKNFDCKDVADNRYKTQRCYKCRGNNCNGSSRRYSISKTIICITSMILIMTSYLRNI